MENYYDILGVVEGASTEEIKRAFRNLAKKYHPDMGGDAERFKKILEAYRVLSDAKLRADYDRRRRFNQAGVGFDVGSFADLGNLESFFRGQQFDDLLADLIGDFFGAHMQEANLDVLIDLEVTLPEIIQGAEKQLVYKRKRVCSQCKGSGSETQVLKKCDVCHGRGRVRSRSSFFTGFMLETESRCKFCHGRGSVPEKICHNCQGNGMVLQEERLQVSLPAQFDPKEYLIIPNMGDEHPRTKRAGKLILRIHPQPDPHFKIQGHDLVTEVEISFIEALVGTELKIKFFNEEIQVVVPAGIMPGELMRIPGKGLQGGSLLVKIRVRPPKRLSARAKKLIDELRQELE